MDWHMGWLIGGVVTAGAILFALWQVVDIRGHRRDRRSDRREERRDERQEDRP